MKTNYLCTWLLQPRRRHVDGTIAYSDDQRAHGNDILTLMAGPSYGSSLAVYCSMKSASPKQDETNKQNVLEVDTHLFRKEILLQPINQLELLIVLRCRSDCQSATTKFQLLVNDCTQVNCKLVDCCQWSELTTN